MNIMNTAFMIDGGAGRALCSIPALLKYYKNNPDDDFIIVCNAWYDLLIHIKEFKGKLYSGLELNLFDTIKTRKIVAPEPYFTNGYINQKKSLIQAFDEIINNTDYHDDLVIPPLKVPRIDRNNAKELFKNLSNQNNKKKFVVFQPFGSTAEFKEDGSCVDWSNRSLSIDSAIELADIISPYASIIYFGPPNQRIISHPSFIDISSFVKETRAWPSIIEQADMFVGIDSLGQHIAYLLNKPGAIIMGGTFEENISYPSYDKFKFFRHNNMKPLFSPLRLLRPESMIVDNFFNDELMDFTSKEISEIGEYVNSIIKDPISNNLLSRIS